jgi:hypothetical protein
VKEKQRLAKMSAGQIRTEQAEQKKEQQAFGYTDARGTIWPRLLTTIVLRGQVVAASTSQYLRSLVRGRDPENAYEFRRMVRLYGDEQINRMMQQP